MYWTSLGISDEDIIALYHNHAVCEQYHSEIKTDMGIERLPSGKFDTNALILKLTIARSSAEGFGLSSII